MKSVKFLCSILGILSSLQLLFPGTAGNTYLPFNPAAQTSEGDVSEFFYWDVGNREKLNYTFLAVEKTESGLHVAEEAYNLTGYAEVAELTLPTGKLSVFTYMNDFLGIQLPSSAEVITRKVKYSDCTMDNQGKLKPGAAGNELYYYLQFEINGSLVPFTGDPELKVIAVFFFKEGIPILGIKNSKYFPLINLNGKWISTGATDWIEMKNQGNFDAGKLLRDRPWTKLAEYIIREDTSGEWAAAQLAYSDLKTEMLVLAARDNYWYPATITGLRNQKVYILYANAEFNDIFQSSSIALASLKPFYWQQGTKISAWLESGHRWVNATIWEIDKEDEQVKIFIEDADIPMWQSLADCRQDAPGSGPAVTSSEREDKPAYNSDDGGAYYDPFAGYDEDYSDTDAAYEDFLDSLYENGQDLETMSDQELWDYMNNME